MGLLGGGGLRHPESDLVSMVSRVSGICHVQKKFFIYEEKGKKYSFKAQYLEIRHQDWTGPTW